MFLPTLCIVVFTILPIVYMTSMAFTNYSKEGNHLVLFDWVGFQNFAALFTPNSSIGSQFGSVLGWTLVWAVLATVSNFFLGTIVAMIINRKTVKLKGLWRTCLSMTIAIPQFVSLMVIRSMLQPEGIINSMLLEAGWITEKLPFLTNATWARVLVLVINLWVGIPYTVMQVTGILQNIPSEQYEAAKIDGANTVHVFRKITLPYMLFVMTPYLITQFTGNINNFNIIYLLTRGEPVSVGNTAGATDLLVTWLYKLSVDQQKYNLGAVIGILTFVVLSVISLATYRSSGSYKNEEGFK
jgi:arabinogalactan oligomer/maltooligosaccharide transport system permease protein